MQKIVNGDGMMCLVYELCKSADAGGLGVKN